MRNNTLEREDWGRTVGLRENYIIHCVLMYLSRTELHRQEGCVPGLDGGKQWNKKVSPGPTPGKHLDPGTVNQQGVPGGVV